MTIEKIREIDALGKSNIKGYRIDLECSEMDFLIYDSNLLAIAIKHALSVFKIGGNINVEKVLIDINQLVIDADSNGNN